MGPASYNLGYSVRLPLLILLATAVCFGAPPETSDYEGQTVVRVDFVPPRQPLTQSHLARVVRVKQGRPLQLSDIRETIRGLFAAGRYSSQIRAEADPVEAGVAVVFYAEPSWFIGEVRVTGVPAPPTESQLVNITGLELGELYTEEGRSLAEQAVRGLLEDNGFFLPSIAFQTADNDESQQRDIEIRVAAGPRAVIGDVIVSGPGRQQDASPAVDELRRIAQWRRGKAFHQRHIQKGLDRLEEHFQRQGRWQSEVRVTGRYFDPDGGEVTFVLFLDPGPRVQVRVEGAEFSRAELRRYVPVFEEGMVDDDLLEEGRRNLRDVLQSRGYFNVRVEVDRDLGREGEVAVVYRIDRGPRHRMVRLDIRGHSFFDLETIRERMLVQERTFSVRRGRFNETLLARDRQAIEDLYVTNGFRDVEVKSRVENNYRGHEGDLAVFIQIEEGSPTFVEQVRIRGAENIPAEHFYPDLASALGQVFSEINVATDRDLILGTYFDNGFQDARFSWRAEPGSAPRLVIIDYEIQEGESLFVRRPIVSGLKHTRGSLVDSQIRITPGGPLSQSRMLETQRRLYDLGLFSRVDVDLQNPEGNEPSKNVLLQVQEARRWTVGVGGGAEFARIGGNTADVTSPVGEASFSPRITLELTRLNVRGIGHTASIRTRFSNLQQRALFTYEAPRTFNSDKWRMIFSGLVDTSRNVRTFTGRRAEGALQLQQRLSKPSTVLYRYTFRRTSIDENTLQITPDLIPLQAKPVRVALLSGTYFQDRRDDPTDATKGMFNSLDLSLASGGWGSQANFARFLGQNSTYYRLGKSFVLARTVQLGLIAPRGAAVSSLSPEFDFASNPDQRIPLSERFFGGGANSHRGFPVNQAGPRDPTTGFPIGGGALFVNSVELRFPLIGESIGGVLFHDAGNIYSRFRRISFRSRQDAITAGGATAGYEFDYMVHAIGFGLRYRTPVGPVRLDLGYSLNPPRFIGFEGSREELLKGGGMISNQRISSFQFHFSLGQRF